MSAHFHIQKNFFPQISDFTNHYDSIFKKPLEATADRFCWDYWNVPDQYTHLRTPAWEFFPEDLYSEWHQAIVRFGQENLGCHEITPPWLSCYIDGCKQELHADLPHGPWAFVFSLTAWKKRSFQGGETLILKPKILNYWQSGTVQKQAGLNSSGVYDVIAPEYNQLLVFDPRYPHGVREVRGTQDVAAARLVIHGWFVDPKPWVLGGLQKSEAAVAEVLNDFVQSFVGNLGDEALDGILTLRLSVGKSGKLENVRILSNTLVILDNRASILAGKMNRVLAKCKAIQFPKASKPSQITLPLIFS